MHEGVVLACRRGTCSIRDIIHKHQAKPNPCPSLVPSRTIVRKDYACSWDVLAYLWQLVHISMQKMWFASRSAWLSSFFLALIRVGPRMMERKELSEEMARPVHEMDLTSGYRLHLPHASTPLKHIARSSSKSQSPSASIILLHNPLLRFFPFRGLSCVVKTVMVVLCE